MTAQKGSLFLLKIGNGEVSEVFTTIAGMQRTEFTLQNQVLDSTNVQSSGWRTLIGNCGIKSLSISGSGIFMDTTSEETFRSYAFLNAVKNYELSFGNGDKISGPFLIRAYQREGEVDGEELYNISLESAGIITYSLV